MTDETLDVAKTDEPGGSIPTIAQPKSRTGKEIMALKAGAEIEAVVPTTLEEALRFAQMVCMAGLAPKSYDTNNQADPQKVVIGILTALELGVKPLQGLSGIAIINGRPSIWGDLAVALCQSKGVLKSFEHTFTGTEGKDDYTCHVTIWRKGQDAPYTGSFSIGDARRAQLWANPKRDPWVKYPYRMLFNRARAFALRDGFADCLSGLAIAEEAQDLPAAPAPVNADEVLSDEVTPALQIEDGSKTAAQADAAKQQAAE